jgi:hypothetical protein
MQVLQRPRFQLRACLDTGGMHPRRRRRTDAVKRGDRQRFDKRGALLWRNGELALRLALA